MAVVGLAVAALAMFACGADKEPLGPTATVAQATTTTKPYAIPPVIDEAYVNRVLAGLDHAVGDVTRIIVASQTIPPEAIDRLKAIYLDTELLQLVVDTYQKDLLHGLEGIRPTPGDRNTTVTDLLTVKSGCVFAAVRTDASAVALTPNATYEQWIGLIPTKTTGVTVPYNTTNWGFVYEGFTPDLSSPPDPCVAS
jgi:hypothetical protein